MQSGLADADIFSSFKHKSVHSSAYTDDNSMGALVDETSNISTLNQSLTLSFSGLKALKTLPPDGLEKNSILSDSTEKMNTLKVEPKPQGIKLKIKDKSTIIESSAGDLPVGFSFIGIDFTGFYLISNLIFKDRRNCTSTAGRH